MTHLNPHRILEDIVELIRARLLDEFGELAKGISIECDQNPDQGLIHITTTFEISVESTLTDEEFYSDFYALEQRVFHSLHNLERALYAMLPVYQTEPQIAGTKIRIDSHLPKGVIWMHPKTYTSLKQNANPELRL